MPAHVENVEPLITVFSGSCHLIVTDAFKFSIVGLFTGLGVTVVPPLFAWSVPSSSMNVVLPSGLTLPRVPIVAIGTVASLPLSPLGPLIFTVSGLAIPSVLLQLMFPSVSTLGMNVVPFLLAVQYLLLRPYRLAAR